MRLDPAATEMGLRDLVPIHRIPIGCRAPAGIGPSPGLGQTWPELMPTLGRGDRSPPVSQDLWSENVPPAGGFKRAESRTS